MTLPRNALSGSLPGSGWCDNPKRRNALSSSGRLPPFQQLLAQPLSEQRAFRGLCYSSLSFETSFLKQTARPAGFHHGQATFTHLRRQVRLFGNYWGESRLTLALRHGNRLDAADKQWHLTSPTPYDTPLTYSGLLQARRVGNQIANILEQAKLEEEVRNGETRRKRFKVVVHSSPFLRCVQTSIALSSGLAQTPIDSIYNPSDIVVPPYTPSGQSQDHRTTLLRLDSFLGEWLCPEYFEMITPPPGPALMIGGAKAELLRREDYSMYTSSTSEDAPAPKLSNALWQGSPSGSPAGSPHPIAENDDALGMGALAPALPIVPEKRKGYAAPKPLHPVQMSGKIPDGFVAHARDACVTVDYQWDSMRAPQDFGDGGKFGEEWAAMHKRFRMGLRKLINWYITSDAPEEMVTAVGGAGDHSVKAVSEDPEEDVDTVLVLVSHGAGCNALMGAITHQPVLMDVAIASLTMATAKPDLDYNELLETEKRKNPEVDYVAVDQMYQMRMSASTEHLQPTNSTPLSARAGRSSSVANNNNRTVGSSRGRTSTFSGSGGPVMSPFVATDYFSLGLPRSVSASVNGTATLHKEASERSLRNAAEANGSSPAPASNGEKSRAQDTTPPRLWTPPGASTPPQAPAPPVIAPSAFQSPFRFASESLFDEEEEDSFGGGMLPDFDNSRFSSTIQTKPAAAPAPSVLFGGDPSPASGFPRGPMFAGPIHLQTDLMDQVVPEEVTVTPLGGGLGGIWGQPPLAIDLEPVPDMSHTKRRWTTTDQERESVRFT